MVDTLSNQITQFPKRYSLLCKGTLSHRQPVADTQAQISERQLWVGSCLSKEPLPAKSRSQRNGMESESFPKGMCYWFSVAFNSV